MIPVEVSRGAGAQARDCKRDRLWVRFQFEEIKYLIFSFHRSDVNLISRQSAAFCSASQHSMPREFGGKWATKCLNTISLTLSTLLHAG